MNVEDRLYLAGIGASIGDNGVPLSQVFSPTALLAIQAYQPNNSGQLDNRLKAIASALALPAGLPPHLIAAWPIPEDTNPGAVIARALASSADALLPVAGYMKLEDARPAITGFLSSHSDQECFDAAAALVDIGATPEDVAAFAKLVKGDDDDRKIFGLAMLTASGQLISTLETGDLGDAIDANESIATLVSFATEGALDGLADLITDSGWAQQLGIFRLIHATGTEHASPELLEILLSVVEEIGDNDVLITASWAIGACIRALGADAAEMVLKKCRDDFGNGSVKKSLMLNTIIRLEADSDSRTMVNGLLAEIGEADEDSDTGKALGRVRSVISGTLPAAQEWLFPTNYGRVVDVYEPIVDSIVPASVRAALEPPVGDTPASSIGYVKAGSMDATLTALLTSRAAVTDPSVVAIYRDWFSGDSKLDGNQKSGLAATMILSEVDHGVSPVLLRCYLGAQFGGPLPESGDTIGELIAYSTNWNLRESAYALMTCSSIDAREIFAGFLQASLSLEDNDDQAMTLMRTGIPSAAPNTLGEPSLLLRLAAGAALDSTSIGLIGDAPEDQKPQIWGMLENSLMSGKIDALRPMVRSKALLTSVPTALAQGTIEKLINGTSWIHKEIGSTAAGTLGSVVLEGDAGPRIRDRLLALINDNDSDVVRESKAACEVLGLEVIEINPDTIRTGICRGEDDFEAWVERGVTFIGQISNAGKMRELARVGVVWQTIGLEKVQPLWLELANASGWVQREAAGLIAASFGADLLTGDKGGEIHDKLIALVKDFDSDVKREAKVACDTLGLEYPDED